MMRLLQSLLMAALVCVGGCTAGVSNFALVSPAGAEGSIENVLVATNRTPDADPSIRFSGKRHDALSFANIGVWVPKNRQAGELHYPYTNIDPSKHFAAVAYEPIASEHELLTRLNNKLSSIHNPLERRVIIFIHGYNVDFGEGVIRQAQIVHDFGFEGAALHFSWPSAGEISRYLYDRDSAHFSRNALADMLDLVSRSQAESIMVFAHSMGTFLTMETLLQLSLDDRSDILSKLDPLILASPDIDMDVFRTQLNDISPRPKNIVTLVSQKDGVLRLSERLRGGIDTVGKGDKIEELQSLGLTVVDMTAIEDSFTTAHNTFAESPTLLKLIQNGGLGRLFQGADDHQDRDSGLGALSDLAASIIYLPARVMGDR